MILFSYVYLAGGIVSPQILLKHACVCVCVFLWACVWPFIISTICHIRTPLERRVIFTVARQTSLVWIEVERGKNKFTSKQNGEKKCGKRETAQEPMEKITFMTDFSGFFLCRASASLMHLQACCYRLTILTRKSLKKKECMNPIIILAKTQLQN